MKLSVHQGAETAPFQSGMLVSSIADKNGGDERQKEKRGDHQDEQGHVRFSGCCLIAARGHIGPSSPQCVHVRGGKLSRVRGHGHATNQ